MTAASFALAIRPCRSHRRERGRGFALITAIILLGLIAALMVTMTSQMSMQIRRDTSAEQEAQFRELLLAGQAAARQTLDPASPERCQLPVPSELAARAARITCTRDAANPTQVLVQATLDSQSRQQRLYYRSSSRGWQLYDAILDPE